MLSRFWWPRNRGWSIPRSAPFHNGAEPAPLVCWFYVEAVNRHDRADDLAPGGPLPTEPGKPLILRVMGVTKASLAMDWLILSGIAAALFAPLAYVAARMPQSEDHTVRMLLGLSVITIVSFPAMMKLLPLLGWRFDEGIIEITAGRVVAVAIGPRSRVRQECRIADVRAMGFFQGSGAIVVWLDDRPKRLLCGLNGRSLRRAAEDLRAATGWPTPADIRPAGRMRAPIQGGGASVDFRDDAVAASRAAMMSSGGANAVDLTSTGTSVCVPAPGDAAKFRRVLAAGVSTVILVALGGLAAGIIAIPMLGRAGIIPSRGVRGLPLYGWLSGAAVLIGYAAMINAVTVRNALFLRWLRCQAGLRPLMPLARRTGIVSIEDPVTASRIKLVEDDLAAVFPDPTRRLILLEGYSHRYVIRAEDVVEFYPKVFINVPSVVIAFRVGGSEHVLRLKLSQVVLTFRRGASGRPWSPLPDTLQRTFGIPMGVTPSPFA